MPGYEQYQKLLREIPTALRSGALAARWSDDSRAVEYTREGKPYRFDIASRQTLDNPATGNNARDPRGQVQTGQPDRGRQFTSSLSPDGRLTAFYRNRN